MAFKIKDGVRIGTVDVFNNSGALLVAAPSVTNSLTAGAGLTGGPYNGSGAITLTIDSTVATLTGTQTLTNKTLAAASNTITGLTNSNLSGTAGITNANLANSFVTIGSTSVSLGATVSTFTGLTSVTSTTFVGTLTGDASTATTLATPRNINSVSFNGSSDITITAANPNTLTIGTGLSGTSYSGASAVTIALENTAVTAGSYTSANITVDAQGRITAAASGTATEADTLQTVTGRGATSNTATISLTGGTASTTTGTGTLVVTGGVGVSGAINIGGNTAIGGNLTVSGDFTVNGTTTTVNSTTITVDDKNLELGSVATPTDITADGGGITLKGTSDKTLSWINSTAAWTSSEHLAVAAGKTLRVSGSTSGTASIVTAAYAGSPTLTLPITTGTFALTDDIKDGTLGAAASSAGATNTTVALYFSAAYSANSASNVTINPVVGPAFTALATLMTTAGAGFIKRGATADTYTIDTNTYLTAEADTLATVTGREATTSTAVTFTNSTDSTTLTTGAVQISGGLAVTKNLVVGGEHINTTGAGTVISSTNSVQATVTTTSAAAVDTWATATYRSAKYLVQITQGSNYQVSELLVIHNGTTTFMTEFAVLETNAALGTFTSDISAGNARLLVTMSSATSATINIEKIAMVV